MSNAMSQRASEEPEDQVQGASNTAGTAVDATTINGTSGNTDISEEDSDAWYRNHNVPPNSFASSSSRSSSRLLLLHLIGGHNTGQPQHHPQQHNHHPHPNPIPIPNHNHNLNHPQSNQHPPPAQDPLFRRLCTTWLRHLHHVLQAHALVVRAQHIHDTRWLQVNSHLLWTVAPLTEEARLWWVAWHTQNERRMLREAEWRLWVLMNEDTPRLVRVVRGYAEGGWGGGLRGGWGRGVTTGGDWRRRSQSLKSGGKGWNSLGSGGLGHGGGWSAQVVFAVRFRDFLDVRIALSAQWPLHPLFFVGVNRCDEGISAGMTHMWTCTSIKEIWDGSFQALRNGTTTTFNHHTHPAGSVQHGPKRHRCSLSSPHPNGASLQTKRSRKKHNHRLQGRDSPNGSVAYHPPGRFRGHSKARNSEYIYAGLL
ncbi:hypothetical protein NEUTE2DRAFT_142142 [Neurospora tetrasperma FGSC 2509]|nr:hypothetical protein NEUTE2DRAFT_142142 [Neurospora tetrasperma FGSC 2509]